MKKILTILILALLIISPILADPTYSPAKAVAYKALSAPYTKTSARVEAMGGAGIAGFNNPDALYINPASLANKGFVLNLPSVAFTIYDFKELVDTGLMDEIAQNTDRLNDGNYIASLTTKLLPVYGGKMRDKIIGFDAGIGTKLGLLALAIDTKLGVLTYTPGGASSLEAIPQFDIVASAGLGFRVFDTGFISMDLGVAARVNLRIYSASLKAQDIIDESGDIATMINNKPIMTGYALPLDIGVNLNLPLGFTISAVAKNLHGAFTMYSYANADAFKESQFKELIQGDGTWKFDTDPSYNLGLGWNPDFGKLNQLVKLSLACDVIGIDKVFKDFKTENLYTSSKIGAEVKLLNLVELRAGLNQGYKTVGLGFNLFRIIHLEASYYWTELGDALGDNPVDAFTIRFNILWE